MNWWAVALTALGTALASGAVVYLWLAWYLSRAFRR